VRDATSRLLDAEFAAGTLEIEVSAAADDLLLRAYQHSLARESPTVSVVDILVAWAWAAATTAGMALQDVGVTVERLAAVAPLPSVPGPAAEVRATEHEPASLEPAPASRMLGEEAGAVRRAVLPAGLMFGGVPALPGTVRSGIGYDSHRFEPGGPMTLGGVSIDADVHLVGHSDGDAIAHAVTDAILGAAAAGDIGEMFSDQDDANRGRDSIEMLRAAVDRVARRGFAIGQVDVTVIAERPRLAPHRGAICERLADALGVPLGSVSVKGKTNEGMGWVGRGEGLACIAVATIVAASDA
jgi:2-C-methyl-D-erythritol 2,4-cyclodiphosphate synthase